MNNIVIKGIYELDLDKNGAVALTAKNIELINAIIKIDSSYRVAFDEKDERSAAYYIKNVFYKEHKFDLSEETIEEVVKRLDKENSTHLSVSGNKKGDNQGIKLTAKKISQIRYFEKRISSFDSSLVKEISEAVDGRNNFSFASKFCTYVSRFALPVPSSISHNTNKHKMQKIRSAIVAHLFLPYETTLFLRVVCL